MCKNGFFRTACIVTAVAVLTIAIMIFLPLPCFSPQQPAQENIPAIDTTQKSDVLNRTYRLEIPFIENQSSNFELSFDKEFLEIIPDKSKKINFSIKPNENFQKNETIQLSFKVEAFPYDTKSETAFFPLSIQCTYIEEESSAEEGAVPYILIGIFVISIISFILIIMVSDIVNRYFFTEKK